MSPEEAEEILVSRSMKDLLEAHRAEIDKEWAERYLSMQESMKSVSWQLKEGYLSPTPLFTET